jgi:chemotaxis protein CheX
VSDIREVFCTMVGTMDLSHLAEQFDPVTHFEDCVSAMVGLAGSYNGVVGVHTPHKLALDFTTGMLGVTVTELDDDVNDALGEIANMIAGCFKQHLSSGGTDIQLSTPSVVTGKDYFIAAGKPENTLTLGFATGNERFLVSAALEKNG